MITYSLSEIPFSIPHSFLTVSSRNASGSHRLLYGTCSRRVLAGGAGQADPAHYFELALMRAGHEVPYTWEAHPHRVDLTASGGGTLVLTFADPETLVFEAQGVNLRLLPCKGFPSHWRPAEDTLAVIDWAGRSTHLLRAAPGASLQVTPQPAQKDYPPGYDEAFGVIDFSGAGALRYRLYEDFWREPFPSISSRPVCEFEPLRDLAGENSACFTALPGRRRAGLVYPLERSGSGFRPPDPPLDLHEQILDERRLGLG